MGNGCGFGSDGKTGSERLIWENVVVVHTARSRFHREGQVFAVFWGGILKTGLETEFNEGNNIFLQILC